MDKKEFIAQAKSKLKTQNEKGWVSEMNFIYSNELVLRVWFDKNLNIYRHSWNKAQTLPIIEQQKIELAIGRYTSNDETDYSAIITSLKKALKEKPESMVDYVEGIEMWEKAELAFTVAEFCELIGLEL